ncbi:unnamed protein product [Mytilus coruscus]|uniref:DUF5641 domain-containing protein n=1 Tax=Mytilus coruscus TaxID=42192 RepID=A0A6J7ZU87_MYTCO|nr:unnamed protein product [Mytilus coruscus]
MSSKLKTVRAAHRRAVIKLLKKDDPAEESQQDVVKLQSMMELIQTKQKTLSELNEKIMEIIEEEEDLDKEIEEVGMYELNIQIGITKIEKYIKEVTNKLSERKGLLLDHFAKRWSIEYLTGLRKYHRASGKHNGQVNIGDVVQLESESPRLLWRLGIIEDVIKGGDGLICAAKVRTSRGLVTTRPIVKLYPLEL